MCLKETWEVEVWFDIDGRMFLTSDWKLFVEAYGL
jgi:hypothetical protein